MISLSSIVLESSILLSVATLIYIFVLRRFASPAIVRTYLLICVLLVLVIPFLSYSIPISDTIATGGENDFINNHSAVADTAYYMASSSFVGVASDYNEMIEESIISRLSKVKALYLIYFIGGFLLLFRLLIALRKLKLLRCKYHIERRAGQRILVVGDSYQPFSFFKLIVIPQELWDAEYCDQVVLHERVHIDQWHSVDVLLSELILLLQWFNPFAWLFKRFVQENHEFLVDKAVINMGISKKEYQKILLHRVMGVQFDLGNSFSSSLTKKRFKMMNNSSSFVKSIIATSCGVLCVGAFCFVIMCSNDLVASPIEDVTVAEALAWSKPNLQIPLRRTEMADTSLEIVSYDTTVMVDQNYQITTIKQIKVSPKTHDRVETSKTYKVHLGETKKELDAKKEAYHVIESHVTIHDTDRRKVSCKATDCHYAYISNIQVDDQYLIVTLMPNGKKELTVDETTYITPSNNSAQHYNLQKHERVMLTSTRGLEVAAMRLYFPKVSEKIDAINFRAEDCNFFGVEMWDGKSSHSNVWYKQSMAGDKIKVVEHPSYAARSGGFEIVKVELGKDFTALTFTSKVHRGGWLWIPTKSCISASNGGNDLYMTSAEGIELDQKITKPGLKTYRLLFPALPEGTELMNFKETNKGGNFAMYEIQL